MKHLKLVINNTNKKKDIFFNKKELKLILNLYAKMVSSGEWKDYGLSISKREVSFNVYHRTSEFPAYKITKNFNPKNEREKYLIKEQADAISEVIRHLGITSAHVLSHDYGDTVAQEMMAQQLENDLAFRIESLHLLNGGLFPETHRALPIQKLLLSPIGGLLIRFLNKNAIRKSMHNIFGPNTPPSDQDIDDFWTLISANNGHQHMHLLLDYMKQRKQYRERWVSALQNANAPLRLTAGMADPISGAHMVARYKQLIPNADVIELDQIGHYPQIESAEAVVKSITSFLGRCAN